MRSPVRELTCSVSPAIHNCTVQGEPAIKRTCIAIAVAPTTFAAATAPAIAADTRDSRFAGVWNEGSGPQQPAKFRTEMVGKRLKLMLPNDVSPPDGETVWLQRTGADQFSTAAGDKVQASFRSTGPNSARLKVKELSVQHMHVFDTDLRRH